jgi:hypothetical protein
MTTYRTKTYIAADWTDDKAAVDKLYEWNNSQYWSLSFTDAHDLTQARDGSLNCSIKKSLATRLDASKTFVLIVGDKTRTLTAGGCQFCGSYNSHTGACARGYVVSYDSFIEYECAKAAKDGLKIVVLYNSGTTDKSKCPEALRYVGTHAAMWQWKDGRWQWDYQAVKNALG